MKLLRSPWIKLPRPPPSERRRRSGYHVCLPLNHKGGFCCSACLVIIPFLAPQTFSTPLKVEDPREKHCSVQPMQFTEVQWVAPEFSKGQAGCWYQEHKRVRHRPQLAGKTDNPTTKWSVPRRETCPVDCERLPTGHSLRGL